ncbi:MAG: [LysW]-aminoadipate/[LysW]-glutamate kinase [Nitrososphaerales archaeon]|nr:[LysW]-aminoadipate/[LysW]-glutamate kinase [Nitrososphaerales archaeon]MCX8191996.1 [LysW]-aminoadipate/[LysW]-glutamate kinase [Nitrososphaerales archaeon]
MVKVGGSILGEGINPTIIDDVVELNRRGKLVLVHGGGRKVTEIAEKLGKKQEFIVSPDGIRSRYTDSETIEIYTMVMSGLINKEIVAALHKVGLRALGLSGVDGGILKAERKKRLVVVDERGRKRIIDGGYTGKISQVNSELLNLILNQGYLPVIAPVAIGEESELLNVDGDRAAAYVAGAIKADLIIFLTDVEGIIIDDKVVEKLTLEEAERLMPKIGFGMKTKVLASIEALKMGVERAVICSGKSDHPLLSAIDGKSGTMITK